MRIEMILLVASATACGEVSSGLGGGDAGGDSGAAVDAAQPGPVQVTVLSHTYREPLADIDVAFFGPDGAHEATVQTGADGVATADLRAGGAVMAFPPPPPVLSGAPASSLVWMVLDVHPGDAIVLGGTRGRGDYELTMTLNVAALGVPAQYWVVTPCFSVGGIDSTAIPVDFHESCVSDAVPWLAVARTATAQYAYTGDPIAAVDGGDVPLEGAWVELTNEDIDLTDVPSTVGLVRGSLGQGRLGGEELSTLTPSDSVNADSSAATISPLRTEGLDELMLDLTIYNEGETLGPQRVVRWSDGGEDTPTVSIEDVLLPWIGFPYFDAATRTFGWPVVGDAEWDATAVTLFWYREDAKTAVSGRWIIVAPPGINEIVLPELPAELADHLPDDLTFAEVFVQLTESSGVDGWDSARALGIDTYGWDFPLGTTAGALTRRSSSPDEGAIK